MNEKLQFITLSETNTIHDAMQSLDKSGSRVVLVVDDERKLVGIVTDGDIRRILLLGKPVSTKIGEVMSKSPVSAPENTPAQQLVQIMLKNNIYQLPIVDEHNIVVDIIFFSDLRTIPLSSQDITAQEVDAIHKVITSPYLSIGPKIKEFEKAVANYVGTKYAIGVNSGTSGLHLAIRSLDIKDGDEVITSPFSFISSANAALFERAKPVFVDIDSDTLCIDPDKIEEKITNKTKAILPIHIFGHPAKMDKIRSIADSYKLAVIEDACEALGSEYQNKKVGSFGDVGIFAFYPNKQITTAEGGMIVTNDEKIAKLCTSMRNQGREENVSWLSHVRLGYNYRMSELSATLGVSQMQRIDEILKKRRGVASNYNEQLKDINGIRLPFVAQDIRMSWFVYVIRLNQDTSNPKRRDLVIGELERRGVKCRNYFPPIHLEPFYVKLFGNKEGDFPITEKVSASTIALPFFNNLAEEEIKYISDQVRIVVEKYTP